MDDKTRGRQIDPIKRKYYEKLHIRGNSEPRLPKPSDPIEIKQPIKKNNSQDDFDVCYSFYYHNKLNKMHNIPPI
jgi:hypothetical protein